MIKHNLLTVQEVAEIFRVDESTVRKWLKNGLLTGVKLPGTSKYQKFLIRSEDVEKLIEGENHDEN